METLWGHRGNKKNLLNKNSADIFEAMNEGWELEFCWKLRKLDKCESPDRVKIKDDNWEDYLEITVNPLDCSDWETERAEIQAKNKLKYGVKYKQNFSFQIPKDCVLDGNRLVIWQWKRSPEITEDRNDAPLLSQRIKIDEKWQLYFVVTDGYRKEVWKRIPIEAILWKRVDMRYEIIFSDTEMSYVSIKATCERNNIKIYEWSLNIPHSKEENSGTPEAYFKFWIYRDIDENNQTERALFKNYKMKKLEE